MKGSQGLEALAALCGGASKAEESNSLTPKTEPDTPQSSSINNNPAVSRSNTVMSEVPSQIQQYALALAQSCGVDQTAAVAASQNPSMGQQVNNSQVLPFNAIPPNVAAILSAAGMPQQQNVAAQMNGMTDTNNALQQLAYLNLIQQQTASTNNLINQQAQGAVNNSLQYPMDANAAMALVLAAQQGQQTGTSNNAFFSKQQQHQENFDSNQQHQYHSQQNSYHQIIPSSNVSSNTKVQGNSSGNNMNPPDISQSSAVSSTSTPVTESMKPSVQLTSNSQIPPKSAIDANPVQAKSGKTNVSTMSSTVHQPILMRRPQKGEVETSPTASGKPMKEQPSTTMNDKEMPLNNSDLPEIGVLGPEEKKQQKRAANRRSAQLSRKRKKQFIEELNKENDDLRRKEQILCSIPDLVLVFDSAGKLWFVSQSVNHLLRYSPGDLEGTSLWERLCDESVRLLKSAFMDALAARKLGSETTPLGSGVWELRMQDKDGVFKWIALNGVVHFSGDAPECVCSIRAGADNGNLKPALRLSAEASGVAQSTEAKRLKTDGEPRQSVSSNQSIGFSNRSHENKNIAQASQKPETARAVATSGRRSAQISDSSSVISETTSDRDQ